jgi:rubrerythrin
MTITREEAIKTLHELWRETNDSWYEEVFRMAIEALRVKGAHDTVKGEWIKTMSGNGWNEWSVLKCPLCGAIIEDKQYHSWGYNYCPNCGKRIKGGDTE